MAPGAPGRRSRGRTPPGSWSDPGALDDPGAGGRRAARGLAGAPARWWWSWPSTPTPCGRPSATTGPVHALGPGVHLLARAPPVPGLGQRLRRPGRRAGLVARAQGGPAPGRRRRGRGRARPTSSGPTAPRCGWTAARPTRPTPATGPAVVHRWSAEAGRLTPSTDRAPRRRPGPRPAGRRRPRGRPGPGHRPGRLGQDPGADRAAAPARPAGHLPGSGHRARPTTPGPPRSCGPARPTCSAPTGPTSGRSTASPCGSATPSGRPGRCGCSTSRPCATWSASCSR